MSSWAMKSVGFDSGCDTIKGEARLNTCEGVKGVSSVCINQVMEVISKEIDRAAWCTTSTYCRERAEVVDVANVSRLACLDRED